MPEQLPNPDDIAHRQLVGNVCEAAVKLASKAELVGDDATSYEWHSSAAAGQVVCVLPERTTETAIIDLSAPNRRLRQACLDADLILPNWRFAGIMLSIKSPRSGDSGVHYAFTVFGSNSRTAGGEGSLAYQQAEVLLREGGFYDKAPFPQRAGRAALQAFSQFGEMLSQIYRHG